MTARPPTTIHDQRGFSALLMTILLGSLTLVIMSSLFVITLADIRIVRNSTNGLRAFHAAESGAERTLSEWAKNPVPTEGALYTNVPITDASGGAIGTYTITSEDLGNGVWRIESIGKSGDAQRKILSDVEVNLGGPHEAFSKALATNSSIALPSNMNIWGDMYIHEGFIESWDSGAVYATDGFAKQFAYEPMAIEAPYGRLEYYYTQDDEWQIVPAPQKTTNGDAHGFWTSVDNIARGTTWLNPLHNIGNPDVPNSGQYWNRKNDGTEELFPSAAENYGLKTGIAVRNNDHPLDFPEIDNGSYANFKAYYESTVPTSTKRANLAIHDLQNGGTINLANGRNNAIIGDTPNSNGYATQFIWGGTAERDDGTTYTGPLEFDDNFALYIDGPVSFADNVGMTTFTVIGSGTIWIQEIDAIPSNFSLIAFDDILIDINIDLRGAFFTSGVFIMNTPANLIGAIVARDVDFRGGGLNLIYDSRVALEVRRWLPGGSKSVLNVITWKEVAP